MNKQPIIIAALLLGLFAVLGSTLVAVTHSKTAQRIADNERAALLKKLHKLVPEDAIDNDMTKDMVIIHSPQYLGAEETMVYLGRKQGQPVAAVFASIAPDGYSGPITLLVAVNADGTLGGVRVVSHQETPGLGDRVDETRSSWIKQFRGLSLGKPDKSHWKVKRDGGYFDQFTGATITPRAVVKAIKNTLVYYQQYGSGVWKQPIHQREKNIHE